MMAFTTHLKIVFVRSATWAYTSALVTTKQKTVRWATGAILVLCTAGCGGINASKSVSPLDFILPGLIQHSPAPTAPAIAPTNSVQLVAVAQVRP
jgi:hypothetical protein